MSTLTNNTCAVDTLLKEAIGSHCNDCGKCVFGYEGVTQATYILRDMTQKRSKPGDINLLLELGDLMKNQSLCEDGVKFANIMLDSLANNREEFEEHASKKDCRNGVCTSFLTYHILPDLCIGCMECLDACDEDAIMGKKKFIHVIDQDECTLCGKCVEACEENAIIRAGVNKPRTPKQPIACKR